MDDKCPWVSYIRLPKLHTVARCCDVSESFLAVGTGTGYLLVFDRRRDHDLRVSQVHRSAVTSLSLSSAYAVSACAEQIAVYNLEGAYIKWTFDFANCLAVAVPSKYVPRHGVIMFGDESRLMSVQRPLTARTGTVPTAVLVHEGEGSVDAIQWSPDGEMVAWHNDRGVKVRDVARKESVTFLALDRQLVRLCWSQESPTLIVSCDNCFKVLRIHPRGSRVRGEVIHTLKTPSGEVVCGVCPDPATTREFFVLTCGSSSRVHLVGPSGPSESSPVQESHVIWHQAFMAYHGNQGSNAGGIYLVIADGIRKVVRRDQMVHAQWFIEQGRYEEAVEVALGKVAIVHKVLVPCVHRALKKNVDRALALVQSVQSKCPHTLTGQVWEDLALAFDERRQMETIAPIIPHQTITTAVADLIIKRLTAVENPQTLLLVVRKWPPDIFSVDTSLTLILERLEATSQSTEAHATLSEVLSRLYVMQGQLDKAFQVVMELRSMSAFTLLEEHKTLFAAQYPNIETFEQLVELDAQRCAKLYVQYYPNLAPKDEIIQRLDPDPSKAPRQSLYLYCKALICVTTLNAEQSLRYITCLLHFGDSGETLAFLEKTEAYNVEDALRLVRSSESPSLEAEVYLLGRSGRTSEALTLLLSDTSSDKCAKAARFIHSQNDEKELWQQVVDYAMKDPEHRIAQVLATWDATNPISVAKVIGDLRPEMGIPKDIASVLAKLLADFELQYSLHSKCAALGEAETVSLGRARYELRHRGALIGAMHAPLSPCPTRKNSVVRSTGLLCAECGDQCLFGEPIAALVGNPNHVMHERCVRKPDSSSVRGSQREK